MSDEDKPDPIEDVRKGLGLLFRAAKGAMEKLPTKDLEGAIVTGVREVSRVIENVTTSIERDIFGKPVVKPTAPKPDDTPEDPAKPDDAAMP